MIFDIEDNPIFAFPLAIIAGETQTFPIRVECRTNYFLRSEAVSGLSVSARRVGSADWIDIEAVAIDLSAWNGTRQNFEIRLAADLIAERKNFKITVSL
jgi:hypothetical protein